MSTFENPDYVGQERADPTDTLIRSILLAAVFLLIWISFNPFPTLPDGRQAGDEGNLANQLGYSILFIMLAVWCALHHPQRLFLLLRPILIMTVLWFALSVATSWDPSASARRFAFALVTIGIAGMVLLLPRNPWHLSDVLAAVVITVLALCCIELVASPSLAFHQASDAHDANSAGEWRGLFGHKNGAGVTMAIFIFIGCFVTKIRSSALGTAIVVISSAFLFLAHSRTAMAAVILAYIVSIVFAHVRPAKGLVVALSIMAGLNLISIGSVYLEAGRALAQAIMPDPTFTGRADVWKFALDHVAQRPITGYGFASFWGTEQVVYGMSETGWANTAYHAHNGYLDLALTVGIPGAALVMLWLIVLPLIDYHRSPPDPTSAPLKLLFLRICLLACYESCFETMFTQVGAAGLILIFAAFGLRFLAVLPLAR